jgi:hypothetical protein
MKVSKLWLGFSLAPAFVLCVLAFLSQSTGPLSAASAIAK